MSAINWKAEADRLNARTFTLPAGWTPIETVAEQMGVSNEAVLRTFGPGLKDGSYEKSQFPVWDSRLSRKVLVTALRKVTTQTVAKSATLEYSDEPTPAPHNSARLWTENDADVARQMAKGGRSCREIGLALGRSKDAVKRWLLKNGR